MKSRSVDILLNILHQRKRMNIEKLSREYNISTRTLKNDMKEIDTFLESINQKKLSIDEKGCFILDEACDHEFVRNELYKMDIYMYKISQEERCIYIIVLLSIQDDYITMEKIAEELFVSRITIVSDLELVKSKLSEYGISILSKSSRGIILSYQEEAFRFMLIDLFHRIITNVRSEGFFQRLMIQKLDMKYPLADFVKYIRYFERKSGLSFGEQVFYENALYLFVACNRIAMQCFVSQNGKTEENYGAALLDYVSQEKLLKVNRKEKKFYCRYIHEKQLYPITRSTKDVELSKIIMYFLSKIGKTLNVHFQEDHVLVESLLMHIKTLESGGKIEIPIDEESFPVEYKDLLAEVNNYAYVIERYLNNSLTDEIKTSIVIHICAALVRNRTYLSKLSVLIACPGSVATGKFLEAQVKNYFNFNIIGVVSAGRISHELELQNEQVDFVISTVVIQNINCPVVTVNPLLEIEDLNAIQSQAFSMGHKERSLFADKKVKQELKRRLETLIKEMEPQNDIDKTLDQIEAAIQEYRTQSRESQIDIASMISSSNIRIAQKELSWKDALYEAGSILEHVNYDSKYVDQIIANTNRYGPYIVISPGVALAHAGVDDGVYQDGLSLLVSKKGIVFEGDVKVHLLFCFCTTGEVEYLTLFKEIIALGKSEKVQTISKLEQAEDVYLELTK